MNRSKRLLLLLGVLAVNRAPAERWADSQADAGAETDEEEVTAYARVGQSSIIYRITAQEYEALMEAGCDTLRHRELLPAELEDVSQVDVTLDGTVYTFTSDGAEDSPVWSYQEQALEDSALSDALQALSADSFTDQSPDGGEELSLTFHLDLEGSPTVTVTLYRYDGASCLAEVDGVPTALVSRSQVVELQEAVYAVVLGER